MNRVKSKIADIKTVEIEECLYMAALDPPLLPPPPKESRLFPIVSNKFQQSLLGVLKYRRDVKILRWRSKLKMTFLLVKILWGMSFCALLSNKSTMTIKCGIMRQLKDAFCCQKVRLFRWLIGRLQRMLFIVKKNLHMPILLRQCLKIVQCSVSEVNLFDQIFSKQIRNKSTWTTDVTIEWIRKHTVFDLLHTSPYCWQPQITSI